MKQLAMILGVILAWPGFLMLGASIRHDIAPKWFALSVTLSALAAGLIAYGLYGVGAGDSPDYP